MLTADTITDEQIRSLDDGDPGSRIGQIVREALDDNGAPYVRVARSSCAEILNERAKAVP